MYKAKPDRRIPHEAMRMRLALLFPSVALPAWATLVHSRPAAGEPRAVAGDVPAVNYTSQSTGTVSAELLSRHQG